VNRNPKSQITTLGKTGEIYSLKVRKFGKTALTLPGFELFQKDYVLEIGDIGQVEIRRKFEKIIGNLKKIQFFGWGLPWLCVCVWVYVCV
jgi:hypothetical protein